MSLPDSFSLLILGQGSTGLDVARWALGHMGDPVLSVTVYGGGASEPTAATRELEERGARFVYGTELVEGSYDICVASPGISEFGAFFASARDASAQIMGEPEFAFRLSPERWCAITGTNGKTTTTRMLEHIMRASGMAASAVGNIGRPAIDAVDSRSPGDWLVAELSSYQLATCSELHPRAAILLNITPDHLAWHRSHDNYAAAKVRVFSNMGEGDLAIVDVEDPGVRAYGELVFEPGRRVLSLGLADAGTPDAAFLDDGVLTVRLDGRERPLLSRDDLGVVGDHNVLNALAAAAAALFCGADEAGVRSGLSTFKPLEHRVEPCGEIGGVRYFNDSKATNTDAVLKALTAFEDDDVVLLLGGRDKGTPLEEFSSSVVERVRAAVCFGEARERFRRALEDADVASRIDIAEAEDLRDAVDVARSLASCGDVVLLSPACASFDEFSGFEERGEAFKAYLASVAAGETDEERA